MATATATGTANVSPVLRRMSSIHLAISTPKYPPTMPHKIVLPSASQVVPSKRPFQSASANGSLAPIIAPQNPPTPIPSFCHHTSGNFACQRRKSRLSTAIAASITRA